MAWFNRLESQLAASDDLVKVVLAAVAVLAVVMILQPSRTARLATALWLVLP